jgi:excisionase family DNA binding protein
MSTNVTDQLLTENEAAGILRVSLTSVRRWRREGRGPTYRKLGRTVRYRPDDLADFIAASRCTETGWRSRQVAA